MTDYKKWDQMNFKELGGESTSSASEASDAEKEAPNTRPRSEVDDYVNRVKAADAAKKRLAELEKEQEVLRKQMERSAADHRRQEKYIRIGMVVVIVLGFFLQQYLLGMAES
ncbi:transmembrane protein, putative [Bodo saltans]|uniref:Transmembrane protein, putative n=1 Tax=Bodo saltans TaxID=75058 RepID=A0A0S4JG11_BODSA|nr:transmembrane protein, putative [Bodo saltans]|eukprot:CUG88135.1 transmembrane protein, putative [Bodo saltans]